MEGYVSLHRQIQGHWIWEDEEPFDKRSAWLDLIMLAGYKSKKVKLNRENKLVDLKEGQFITSELKLADRWKWSKTKVRSFLQVLEEDRMIENKKDNQKRTILTICNYKGFQDPENHRKTIEKPSEDHGETTEEPQKDTTNKDNKANNENKGNNNPPPPKDTLSEDEKKSEAVEKDKFLKTLKGVDGYPYNEPEDTKMYEFLKRNHPEIDIISRVGEWLEINKFDMKDRTRLRICKFFQVQKGQNGDDPSVKHVERLSKLLSDPNSFLNNKDLAAQALTDYSYRKSQKLDELAKRRILEILSIYDFSTQDFWILQELENAPPDVREEFEKLDKQVKQDMKKARELCRSG